MAADDLPRVHVRNLRYRVDAREPRHLAEHIFGQYIHFSNKLKVSKIHQFTECKSHPRRYGARYIGQLLLLAVILLFYVLL